MLTKRKPFTTQINAAVNIENLYDLPDLAEFCKQRHLVMHPEAVHNVMRDGELLPDSELHGKDLDKVELFLRELRMSYPENVRFYTHYYAFYRMGGFGPKFPCRHPSKLISMKPDGSIHLPCAFVTLHKSQAPLREIFASEAAKKIIAQEATLWDFCKGCKIGCPYEVSAYTNSPMLALDSGAELSAIVVTYDLTRNVGQNHSPLPPKWRRVDFPALAPSRRRPVPPEVSAISIANMVLTAVSSLPPWDWPLACGSGGPARSPLPPSSDRC